MFPLSVLQHEANTAALKKLGGGERLLKGLKVDPKVGLAQNDASDVAARKESFGANEMPSADPKVIDLPPAYLVHAAGSSALSSC